MGKETKVGLLVGMCFIVCCAIVLSHHGRRRAEAQSLSVTNAERSRKAPIPLDRDEGAEQATKRLAPKRTPSKPRHEMDRLAPQRSADQNARDHQESTRYASTESADGGHLDHADLDGPFIHRGPAIPGVVTPKPSSSTHGRESDVIVLDDDPNNSGPLVANLPSRSRTDDLDAESASSRQMKADLHKLTSTPNPTPVDPAPRRSEREFEVPRFEKNNRTPEPDRKAQARRAAMDRHVVQEGDNLSQIAYQYYGSSEQRILDAIVKANHESMSSRDHIVVGQTLLLPDIADIELQSNAESADEELATREFANGELADAPSREEQRAGDTHGDDAIARDEEPRIVTEYTVQPGDLLSRIVARQYGRATTENIDAVFNANRDVIKNRDDLRAGMTLKMPHIPGTQGDTHATQQDRSSTEARMTNPKQTATPKSDAPSTFRWYQVKKGDAYSTIAAREMGSSKRWKELAEFNKDIFARPNLLRHGVNIRIPTTVASTPQGGTSSRGG